MVNKLPAAPKLPTDHASEDSLPPKERLGNAAGAFLQHEPCWLLLPTLRPRDAHSRRVAEHSVSSPESSKHGRQSSIPARVAQEAVGSPGERFLKMNPQPPLIRHRLARYVTKKQDHRLASSSSSARSHTSLRSSEQSIRLSECEGNPGLTRRPDPSPTRRLSQNGYRTDIRTHANGRHGDER